MIRMTKATAQVDSWKTVIMTIALAAIPAISGYFSYRASVQSATAAADAAAAKINSQKGVEKVDVVASRIDGRMDELLELARKSSRAEGVIEGAATEKAQTKAAAKAAKDR